MLKTIKQHIQYGKHSIILENGYIACKANASVLANMEGTMVLSTIIINNQKIQISPVSSLSIYYQEKMYSAGKIPNSFYRREGRPTENEILKARLIDRSLRPLIKNFFNEIQINITVLSINPLIDTSIISIIAASTVLNIVKIAIDGPIGAAQVGFINNKLQLNPYLEELNNSNLNLLVCGTKKSIIMVDATSNFISEDLLLKAIIYGHKQQQILINNINEFTEKINNKKKIYVLLNKNIQKKIKILYPIINKYYKKSLKNIFFTFNKNIRIDKLNFLIKKIILFFNKKNINFELEYINFIVYKIYKYIFRKEIIKNKIRIDNRKLNEIRPIDIKLNILPRTHGSVIFTRGDTQALVITTLGNKKQAQIYDEVYNKDSSNFIFHYNFPGYSVGEISIMNSIPKRREIGHAHLAKKGLISIIPSIQKFPYTIRVVSEITESNGSSSMASVCGASLSLMLAGVPIKYHVAGIAMGLIYYKKEYIILTDILGDEDYYGDIDFKLIGNENGISAIQIDLKICNITYEIIKKLLIKAINNIKIIILKMKSKLIKPKKEVSIFAPKIKKIIINTEKIKNIIGKNGIIIKSLTEETSTNIDIEDNGIIIITAIKLEQINLAIRKIQIIINDIIIGDSYLAKIKKINKFNFFLSFDKINNFIYKVKLLKKYNKLLVGKYIKVKIINIDKLGYIYLIIKKIF